MTNRIYAPWPAAPGNAATIVLFATKGIVFRSDNTTPVLPAQKTETFDRLVDAITFQWLRNDQASNANGIRVYTPDDQGVMREIDLKDDFDAATIGSAAPSAVPILAAGQEWRETLLVPHLKEILVQYTAGATGPTNWNGQIAVDLGALVVSR